MVASILGKDVNTGSLVTLEQQKTPGSTYVIGKAGSGKTTLLINMILQDIENGRGLCFLDPHEDAIEEILKRLPESRTDDVILLDMFDNKYTFGLNLFDCKNPNDKQEISRVTSMIMGVFAKLFTASGDLLKDAPNMAETLQNAVPVLLSHHNPKMTMAEMPLLFLHEDARAKLVKPVTNSQIQLFWNTYNRWKRDEQEALTGSTRRRVGNFLTDSFILEIIGQSETTLPFRRLMDTRKILLVKLSRSHELISNLIGSIIVGQIANAAFSRVDTPEENRIPFYLYVDEFQNFATSTFAQILAETRKYRVFPVVAHQWRGQLDKQNREATLNAANLIVFAVSGEDGEELAGNFDTTPPPAEPRHERKMVPREDIPDWAVAAMKTGSPYQFIEIIRVFQHAGVNDIITREQKKQKTDHEWLKQIIASENRSKPIYRGGRNPPMWNEPKSEKIRESHLLQTYFEILPEYIQQIIDPEEAKSLVGLALMGFYPKFRFLDDTLTEPYKNLWLVKDEELSEAFPLFHRFYRDYLTENWDVFEEFNGDLQIRQVKEDKELRARFDFFLNNIYAIPHCQDKNRPTLRMNSAIQ